MKIDVLDTKGKSVEKMDLNDSVFGVEPNTNLLTQYLRVLNLNNRQGTSAVKTRAEVRGGGRKPWRQKGTGRARHGSIRSPIWSGGGVAHGPKPLGANLSLSKKMRQKAIISALSAKVANKQLKVLKELKFKVPKTKEMVEILKSLKLNGKTLLVLGSNGENTLKSARNIKNLNVVSSQTLNGYEVLRNDTVVFVKDAIVQVEEKYATK